MKRKVKSPQISGAAKMRASGKRGVLLGVTPVQHRQLSGAAARELRSLSGYILYHALLAAAASRAACLDGMEPESEGAA